LFLGVTKLQKATISSVMTVLPIYLPTYPPTHLSTYLPTHPSINLSSYMEQLSSHSTDFHHIWYLGIFPTY